MKQLAKTWVSISLIKRILVGLIIGAVIGAVGPADLEVITLLGNLFVGALKGVAPILVFFLVLSALASARGKSNMKTILILYLVSTFLAAIVAVVATSIFPITLTLADAGDVTQTSPQNVWEVLTTLLMNAVSNPVEALVKANYIGILVWAVILGLAMRAASQATNDVFADISSAVSTVVGWIIQFAPFGIFGLVYSAVSTNGLNIFVEYGQIIVLLVACMFFIALVANPIMVFIITRKNPFPLVWRCLKDSGLFAFFTRSSAANIPVNMELCEKLGLNKDTYSVSIPLGATINMAGAAVTITVMSMCAAYTLGISIDAPTAVILSVLAAVSACGASGVAGGSLLLIPLACSLFGISNDIAIQVVAIGFIIGVIQDSCETALNSSSDVLFTATAEYQAWIKAGRTDFVMGKDNITLAEAQGKSTATADADATTK